MMNGRMEKDAWRVGKRVEKLREELDIEEVMERRRGRNGEWRNGNIYKKEKLTNIPTDCEKETKT